MTELKIYKYDTYKGSLTVFQADLIECMLTDDECLKITRIKFADKDFDREKIEQLAREGTIYSAPTSVMREYLTFLKQEKKKYSNMEWKQKE